MVATRLSFFSSRASDSPATYGALQMCFDWLIDWLIIWSLQYNMVPHECVCVCVCVCACAGFICIYEQTHSVPCVLLAVYSHTQ